MISIIIPVLNEVATIDSLLKHLVDHASEENISEIIVVDGGSTDGTRQRVANFNSDDKQINDSDANESCLKPAINVLLIFSEKGRAKQMNKGTEIATGSILYFLHADSFPPNNFDASILSETRKGFAAGCFRMKFDSSHPILKVSQWFTRFNHKSCRGGDQSLFITKDAFCNLGGFNEAYTIYEDCEFINRVYDEFNFVVINRFLITSSRRYSENGTVKLQYHFAMIHLKKVLGASPEKLSAYYHKNIVS